MNTINIDNFEKLLEKKLKENKQSIISELQSVILSEVNKAISDLKIEIFENINSLKSEHEKQKMDLQKISKTINLLEMENNKKFVQKWKN